MYTVRLYTAKRCHDVINKEEKKRIFIHLH